MANTITSLATSVTTSRTTASAVRPVDLSGVLASDLAPLREERRRGEAPRFRSGDDTWRLVEPHLADYGITRVAHLTHLDHIGIPVHMAMKPAGRTLSSGSGKGITELGSTLSAVMEAIEQTLWEEASPVVRIAPQRELAGEDEPFVGADTVPLTRENLLTPSLPLRWMQYWDIVAGEAVWAPAETAYLPFGHEPSIISGVLPSSNGLASGTHVLEAVLCGLMEVIERDGITLGYLTGDTRPIDLGPGAGAPWAPLVELVRRAGLGLTVYDSATSDVGIPTYRATIEDPLEEGIGDFVGYGTALDPDAAIVRAITEAAQGRCLIVAGARDDVFEMQRRARVRTAHRNLRQPVGPLQSRRDVDQSTGSILGDIETTVDRLRQAGFERVLVHRYSRADEPVQAVRVLVPGLEGYKFAYYTPGPRARARLAGMP
jgi:ribosomal protein S12 methylthiotransferase accessory factor